MDNDVTTTAPVPIDHQLTKWEEWRGIVYFIAVVIGTSIAIWHWPPVQPFAPLALLGIGIFFDVVSLAARISTAVTGRYSSGFFLIGLAFYLWAWLSYPHSVLINEAGGVISLWLRKLPDITCLAVAHLLIHVSFGRDQTQEDEIKDAEQKGAGNSGSADAPPE